MAENRKDKNLKVNSCSICPGKCKLQFHQEIEKEIVMKTKPHTSYVTYDPMVCKWAVVIQNNDDASPKKSTRAKSTSKHQNEPDDDNFRELLKLEILSVIKELTAEQFGNNNKYVADLENSVFLYKEKCEEMKTALEYQMEKQETKLKQFDKINKKIADLKKSHTNYEDIKIDLKDVLEIKIAESTSNITEKYDKIIAKLEHSIAFYKDKYEEMKSMLVEKLEHVKKVEKQNSFLQDRMHLLSQRLNMVETSLKHVKVEMNYIQLGQQLNVDFTTPPRLYNTDFQVRDHKMSGGVWLYNRDSNSNIDGGLATSTEYFSTESPGKSTALTGFQMAPGGERRKSATDSAPHDSVDELQRRLDNLRGFNL